MSKKFEIKKKKFEIEFEIKFEIAFSLNLNPILGRTHIWPHLPRWDATSKLLQSANFSPKIR